jgi:hypothetical protein
MAPPSQYGVWPPSSVYSTPASNGPTICVSERSA